MSMNIAIASVSAIFGTVSTVAVQSKVSSQVVVVICSIPPDIPISMLPHLIALDMFSIASKPLPHHRLHV